MRVENIVRIVPAKTKYAMPDAQFLTFEDVTVVPIQTKLLVPSLLTEEEVNWSYDHLPISWCSNKIHSSWF